MRETYRASVRWKPILRSMQPDARPFGKAERQRLIASLVSRRRIGTQHDLLAALATEGCLATQATVSRDIRELGLEKTHDQLGRPALRARAGRAARAIPARPWPRALRSSAGTPWRRRTSSSSSRSSVRRRRSRGRSTGSVHPLVVGTLAGDDTPRDRGRSRGRALAASGRSWLTRRASRCAERARPPLRINRDGLELERAGAEG